MVVTIGNLAIALGNIVTGHSCCTPTSFTNTDHSETFLLVNTSMYFIYSVSVLPHIHPHLYTVFQLSGPFSQGGGVEVCTQRAPLVRLFEPLSLSLSFIHTFPPLPPSTFFLCSFKITCLRLVN